MSMAIPVVGDRRHLNSAEGRDLLAKLKAACWTPESPEMISGLSEADLAVHFDSAALVVLEARRLSQKGVRP